MNKPTFDQLRRDYQGQALAASDVDPNPLVQLDIWLQQAIQAHVPDPTAMVLATVNDQGQPATRVVLLKGLENGQLIFYTHYQSKKGQDIAANPQVAVNFHWPALDRQVKAQGQAQQVPAQVSEAYFHSRPRESQISAWASRQSQIITDRAALQAAYARYATQFEHEAQIPCPKDWGGYAITPQCVEFWQGRPERLHDRLCYTLRSDNQWQISVLAP